MTKGVWRKATRSGNNGACVEVCDLGDGVAVRDSKNPRGAVLTFPPAAWSAFLDRARQGDLAL